jgi:hypothetical protein
LISTLCFALTFLLNLDFKSQVIFLQLPIVFQLSAIYAIGLTSIIQELSWIVSYIILWIPTFFFGSPALEMLLK